ncbi:MAG: LuxR family transcriptional regulator [bacterium]|nr:LuxR family transcriptional regulator [bacterium]
MHARLFASSVLAIAILFFVYDLAVDALIEGEFGSSHFIIEFVVFLGVSVALALDVRDIRNLRSRLRWEERRNMGLSGALAETIDDQMDEWRLTRSEKDVAWMVIKGYRFSEIAQARGVKESTPRLQATSVYAKAGVSGRAEFVAEILQPLLMSMPENLPDNNKISFVRTVTS